MATPGSVQSRYTNAFVSSFDLLKPEKLPLAFARYGDQGLNTFLWLKAMSKRRSVANIEYSHFEEDLKNPTFTSLGIVAAAAAGASQAITLSPTDLNTANQFYPQKDDIIFYKGGKKGIVTAVNVTTPTAPVLTVYPIQDGAAYSLPAVGAGEVLSVISGASSEGAGQPGGIASGLTEFSNNTQIIKSTVSETGTAMTDQTWVTINGEENAPLYMLGFKDMEYRQSMKISHALLVGVQGDGTTIDPETGLAYTFTEGMMTAAVSRGNNTTYTPGAYSVTDLDAYGRILQREFATGIMSYRAGYDHINDMENGLVNYLAGTRVDYTKVKPLMEGAGISETLAVNIGFSYITKGSFTYAISTEPMFNNPQTLGITGSAFPSTALITPISGGKDAKTGEKRNNLGYVYKEKGAYSRENEIWTVAGAGPGMKVIEEDIRSSYMRSEIGGEWFGVNQWIVVTP